MLWNHRRGKVKKIEGHNKVWVQKNYNERGMVWQIWQIRWGFQTKNNQVSFASFSLHLATEWFYIFVRFEILGSLINYDATV